MNNHQYNIKDIVWIHLGESALVKGRVVEFFDLEHLGEGHSRDRELYVIEIKTGIEDVYEVRSWQEISATAQGPINLFRSTVTKNAGRFLKKVGITLPAEYSGDTDVESDDPTAEEIHAAIARSEQSSKHQPIAIAAAKPKRRNFKKKSL